MFYNVYKCLAFMVLMTTFNAGGIWYSVTKVINVIKHSDDYERKHPNSILGQVVNGILQMGVSVQTSYNGETINAGPVIDGNYFPFYEYEIPRNTQIETPNHNIHNFSAYSHLDATEPIFEEVTVNMWEYLPHVDLEDNSETISLDNVINAPGNNSEKWEKFGQWFRDTSEKLEKNKVVKFIVNLSDAMKKIDEIENFGKKEILATDDFHVALLKALYNDAMDTSDVSGPIACFMKAGQIAFGLKYLQDLIDKESSQNGLLMNSTDQNVPNIMINVNDTTQLRDAKIQMNAWLHVANKNLEKQNVDSIQNIEQLSKQPFILNNLKNQPNENNLPQVPAKSTILNEAYERKEFGRQFYQKETFNRGQLENYGYTKVDDGKYQWKLSDNNKYWIKLKDPISGEIRKGYGTNWKNAWDDAIRQLDPERQRKINELQPMFNSNQTNKEIIFNQSQDRAENIHNQNENQNQQNFEQEKVEEMIADLKKNESEKTKFLKEEENERLKKQSVDLKNAFKSGFANGATREVLKNTNLIKENNIIQLSEKVTKSGIQSSLIGGGFQLAKSSFKNGPKVVAGVGLIMNVKDLYDDHKKGEIKNEILIVKTGTKMVGSILIGSAMIANPIFGGIACATYSHGVDKLFQPNLEKYVGHWVIILNGEIADSFKLILESDKNVLRYIDDTDEYYLKIKNGKYWNQNETKNFQFNSDQSTRLNVQTGNDQAKHYEKIPSEAKDLVGCWEYYAGEFRISFLDSKLILFEEKDGKTARCDLNHDHITKTFQGTLSDDLVYHYQCKRGIPFSCQLFGSELQFTSDSVQCTATPKLQNFYGCRTVTDTNGDFKYSAEKIQNRNYLEWYKNQVWSEYCIVMGFSTKNMHFLKILKSWGTEYYTEKMKQILRSRNENEN